MSSIFRRGAIAAFAALFILSIGAPSHAADDEASPIAPPAAAPLPIPKAQNAVTHRSATIGGRSISYTATAGTILLRDAKDEPSASVFYVAYVANGLGSTSHRPLTFSYNGGPGGSSALVHIGAFGPRMVMTTDGAATAPPPYRIVDNADSLLDKSDLVFVDAVGTGFSRLVGKGTAKQYYGVDQDGQAFEQFVRRYITANDRWNSPKYLLGESYGTTRSAVLAKMMQDDGIAVTGVTLMSTVLDFATLIPQPGGDEPYWMFLPTEAAVAAYHHKLDRDPGDVMSFVQTVRDYARGPYAAALARGTSLTATERDAVAAQLHGFTGLPADYFVRSKLRVTPDRFQKELLHSEQETVGRYDGRFTEFDLDPVADGADTDPSSDAVFGAFTAAFNQYVRSELHYKTEAKYEFLSRDVNRTWDWKRAGRGAGIVSVNVLDDLQAAMTQNPSLRVFSANGIYDLATPFFATEYSLAHIGLPPALQSHISYGYYPSGHMVYLNPSAHARLKNDLSVFYK